MPRTVNDVISRLAKPKYVEELEKPIYTNLDSKENLKIALSVPSMLNHMSNEGWQIMMALQKGKYKIFGKGLGFNNETNVSNILSRYGETPSVVVVQDKREWDRNVNPIAIAQEYWYNTHILKKHDSIFKLTILKDAHQNPLYHMAAAYEIGCNAWIVYYHPDIVNHLAPYTRKKHLIRTYHTIDPKVVPEYSPEGREGALLSGAISWHYPLRIVLINMIDKLPGCAFLPHPGYHNLGTHTDSYLTELSKYKVAICTTSIYGYSLRKLIEATACGCIVITDQPVDDELPFIDSNLIRVEGRTPMEQATCIANLLPKLYQRYDPDRQKYFSDLAIEHYNYETMGVKLSEDIETLRGRYNEDG